MKLPPLWNQEELAADAAQAKTNFRRERLDEPLQLYTEFFERFVPLFNELIDNLPTLATNPLDTETLAELVKGKDRQKAFRYLTAPPISADDLKILADASLTPKSLRANPDEARRVRDTVLQVLDHHRFPWVSSKANPTKSQRESAVVASAALAAAREVETQRRNTSKDVQERDVKALLAAMGYKEVPRKPIPLLSDAPQPKEFCGETTLAGTRADVVVRLPDKRILAIECKVSNSKVNSYKRLVHDTGGKAATWYRQLGRAQIIPAAVLAGVYSTANLETAQNEKEVFLFW